MKNPFNFLGNLIAAYPIRTLGIATLGLLLLLPGTSFVKLATGIETLIKPSTSVYKDNVKLESSFGGDTILVLYTADDINQTLTAANLNNLDQIETALHYTPGVYSVITPATMVKRITQVQSEKMQAGVGTMSSGLDEMADKLALMSEGISRQRSQIQSPGKNPAEALGTLAKGQDDISAALGTMQTGLNKLGNGYETVAKQLKVVGENFTALSDKLNGNFTPEKLKVALGQLQVQFQQLLQEPLLADNLQAKQILQQLQALESQLSVSDSIDISQVQSVLSQSGSGLLQLSEKMHTLNVNLAVITENMLKLKAGTYKTSEALNTMQSELGTSLEKQAELPAQLATMQAGLTTLSDKLKYLSSNLASISKRNGNLDPGIPETQEQLDEILYDNGRLRSVFENVLTDNSHMLGIIRLQGNLDDKTKEAVITRVEQLVKDYPIDGASVMVSGKSVLDTALRAEMRNSMQRMVALAVGIMLLVLAVVFRVRWRILSLPIIFASVIGTMGLMGFSSVPVTMVSMAVFPILIGLGVDYAIQFQNRYQEELQRGEISEA